MIYNANEWPLRFHNSPWLHKEFMINNYDNDQSMNIHTDNNEFDDFDQTIYYDNNNDDFSINNNNNNNIDMAHKQIDSCDDQDGDGCNRCFQPSIHCQRKFKHLKQAINADTEQIESLTVDELMSISRVERVAKQENRQTMTFQRCLFINETLINDICHPDNQQIRKELLENLHLRSCRRFSIERSLSKHLYSSVINTTECSSILKELLLLDNLVEQLACEYESILNRYDCHSNWSVVWTCLDCRLAYRDWLCSVIIPYHLNGNLIKPCQSVCEQVEQKCPHLHPYGKGQYAGEPVFLCIDPNIPFNKDITPNIPFGDQGQCYTLCDLEPCYNDQNEAPNLNCITKSKQPSIDINDQNEFIEQFNQKTALDYSAEQFDDSFITTEMEMIDEHIFEDQQTTEFTFPSTISSEQFDLNDNYFDAQIFTSTMTTKDKSDNTSPAATVSSTDSTVSSTIRTKDRLRKTDTHKIDNMNTSSTMTSTTSAIDQTTNVEWIDEDDYIVSSLQNDVPNRLQSIHAEQQVVDSMLAAEMLEQYKNMITSNQTDDDINKSMLTTTTVVPSTIDQQDIYNNALTYSTTSNPFDLDNLEANSNEQQQQFNEELKQFFESNSKQWTTLASTDAKVNNKQATSPFTTTESAVSPTTTNNMVKWNETDRLSNVSNSMNTNHLYRHYNSRKKDKQQVFKLINDTNRISMKNSQRSIRAAMETNLKSSNHSLMMDSGMMIHLLIIIQIIHIYRMQL